MAITGDRYVADYEGHTIELIRDNWIKVLSLHIDGVKVASGSIMLPHDVILTAVLDHDGTQHTVTAKSLVDRILFTKDSIEVDGQVLEVTKTK